MINLANLEIVTYIIEHHESASIELTQRRGDGAVKWDIVQAGMCFNKAGEWEYEPMPSSRTDEFIARTRWEVPQEALDHWVQYEGESRF